MMLLLKVTMMRKHNCPSFVVLFVVFATSVKVSMVTLSQIATNCTNSAFKDFVAVRNQSGCDSEKHKKQRTNGLA
jgi:hypothetical protein